jgi:hypothetical protein
MEATQGSLKRSKTRYQISLCGIFKAASSVVSADALRIRIWLRKLGNLEAADRDFGRPGGHVGSRNLLNVIKSVEIGRKPCVAVSLGAIGSFHY